MSKISYPFAAVPNHVVRGGHGITNIAVLAVLLSHGKTTASAQTLANELGCARKTIFAALKYWREHGPDIGIVLHEDSERSGQTNVIEIIVKYAREPDEEPVPKGERVLEGTRAQRGTGVVPKGEHLPVPNWAHKEEPSKKNPIKKIPPIPPKGDTDGFDRFWSCYPRKVGKGASLKAWKKIRPSQSLIESILAAVAEQKKSRQWQKQGGQFIPHPTTWLNQGRWDDELEVADEPLCVEPIGEVIVEDINH